MRAKRSEGMSRKIVIGTRLVEAIVALMLTLATTARGQVPLVASWDMTPDPGRPGVLVDRGGLKQDGEITGAQFVHDPQRGNVLAIDGDQQSVTVRGDKANSVRVAFSVTCWLNIDRPGPTDKPCFVVRRGENDGWQLALSGTRAMIHGNWGGGWYQSTAGGRGTVPIKQWFHYAMTFEKGGKWCIYVDGKEVLSASTPYAIWPAEARLKLGGSSWAGKLSDVKIYASSLTPSQIEAEKNGSLATRPATDADFPGSGYPVRMALGRYDMPEAFSGFCFRCKQTAQRVPGPDAVDWPIFHLSDGTKLFEQSGEQLREFDIEQGAKSMSLFPRDDDLKIEPAGLWLRGIKWRWGLNFIYTSDMTARSWMGDYEMWVFPVKISGAAGGSGLIHSVSLKLKGEQIYRRDEALHSLTLLVPANPAGQPYELTINDLPVVHFDAGIKPIQVGNPEYVPITGNYTPSPQIHVSVSGSNDGPFPHQKAWDQDLAQMKESAAALHDIERAVSAKNTPAGSISAETALAGNVLSMKGGTKIFTVEMSAGMSGMHYFSSAHGPAFKGSVADYAQFLAKVGYDLDIESINVNTVRKHDAEYDSWIAALADSHLAGMLNVEGFSHQAMLGGPNIAFYSATLPEWHRPLYREYQLIAQRFSYCPKFCRDFHRRRQCGLCAVLGLGTTDSQPSMGQGFGGRDGHAKAGRARRGVGRHEQGLRAESEKLRRVPAVHREIRSNLEFIRLPRRCCESGESSACVYPWLIWFVPWCGGPRRMGLGRPCPVDPCSMAFRFKRLMTGTKCPATSQCTMSL